LSTDAGPSSRAALTVRASELDVEQNGGAKRTDRQSRKDEPALPRAFGSQAGPLLACLGRARGEVERFLESRRDGPALTHTPTAPWVEPDGAAKTRTEKCGRLSR